MGNYSGIEKNLKLFARQFTALLIIFSIAIPQNLFANNSSDGDGSRSPGIDFSVIPTEALAGSTQTINTVGEVGGQKYNIDVIQGTIPADKSELLIEVIKSLEPQLQKIVKYEPNTKIKFISALEGEGSQEMTAAQLLEVLRQINPKAIEKTSIPPNLLAEYKELMINFFYGTKNIFNKTSKNDLSWAFARLIGSGTGTTLGFYYGSGFPLPTSLLLATIIGGGSASIGVFLQKFTGWLENNKVTPENKRRYNRIGSVETYMLLSPILIGIQDVGFNTPEGAALLAGTAALSVVVQNIYFYIKQRSPKAAMWYKWYATEILFLSASPFVLPFLDQPSEQAWKAAATLFTTALWSTLSQGVWDILITDKLRKPKLEAAIRKDISDLAERISKTPITDPEYKKLIADKKKNEEAELKIRNKYNFYFYTASLISVLSAISMTMGNYQNIDFLTYAGTSGLLLLGSTGVGTWIYVKYESKLKSMINRVKLVFTFGKSEKRSSKEGSAAIRTCTSLFAM